ncbi:MAG: hypothetical protein CMF59_05450 [Leptospiraceae bacterium]|nr:hypothetical protein [Leptospiraceae bacterium]
MPVNIMVREENGASSHSWRLELPSDTLTVAQLIESRVRQEVRRKNDSMELSRKPLGWPKKRARIKPLDAKTEIKRALQAFEQNGFFIFIDEVQKTGLKQSVRLDENTEITFIQLVPLAGG